MANKRTWKKKNNTMLTGALQQLRSCTERIEEVIRLFYNEYHEMKKNHEKKYLLQFIRLREEMLRDIVRMKKNGVKESTTIHYLKMYTDQFTDILEDHGVEIIVCQESDTFNSEIMKPLTRVDTDFRENHNKVAGAYSSAYKWKGMILKKMDVAVYVYSS